jgi:hypothetical protein
MSNKKTFISVNIFIILFILLIGLSCGTKKSSLTNPDPQNTATLGISSTITKTETISPIVTATTTSTITPTQTLNVNVSVTDISAQLTRTCFSVNTSSCSSATSAVIQDADGNLWASEMTACAYFKKYNNTGTEIFSLSAPMVNGMAVDKANNWVWYSMKVVNNEYIVGKDSNNISGTAKASFNIPITSENYFRIAFDGTYLWVLYADTSYNWQCAKYTITGTLLGSFSISQPHNGGYYWGITYGDGYLWLSSYDNNNGYIYRMSLTGSVDTIYNLGSSFMTFGIDWVATNTFWIACQNQVCQIKF